MEKTGEIQLKSKTEGFESLAQLVPSLHKRMSTSLRRLKMNEQTNKEQENNQNTEVESVDQGVFRLDISQINTKEIELGESSSTSYGAYLAPDMMC